MSDNTFDLYYDGIFYKLTRDTNESFDTFYQRCWYISKKKPTNQDELDKYNKPNIKIEEWSTTILQKDHQYKILDITDIDYNWNYFNVDKLVNKNKEYLDEIDTDLNNMCKHFEIKEKVDGYQIKHGLFIFFN